MPGSPAVERRGQAAGPSWVGSWLGQPAQRFLPPRAALASPQVPPGDRRSLCRRQVTTGHSEVGQEARGRAASAGVGCLGTAGQGAGSPSAQPGPALARLLGWSPSGGPRRSDVVRSGPRSQLPALLCTSTFPLEMGRVVTSQVRGDQALLLPRVPGRQWHNRGRPASCWVPLVLRLMEGKCPRGGRRPGPPGSHFLAGDTRRLAVLASWLPHALATSQFNLKHVSCG